MQCYACKCVRVCVRDRASIGLNPLLEEKRSLSSKTERLDTPSTSTDGRDDLPGQAAKKGTAEKSKKERKCTCNTPKKPSCCCGWLRTAAGCSEQALSHVGQKSDGGPHAMRGVAGEPIAELQASQKRLQSCTAERKRGTRRAARAVSPLSHAFSCFMYSTSSSMYVPVPFAGGRCCRRARYRKYLACAALRYQYIIRGGVPAMAQTVGTLGLGNARRYSTKLPVCPVLIYCCSCCSLLAFFCLLPFLFSYLLSSLASSVYPSIGSSSPAYLFSIPFKSILNISPLTSCRLSPPISTFNTK